MKFGVRKPSILILVTFIMTVLMNIVVFAEQEQYGANIVSGITDIQSIITQSYSVDEENPVETNAEAEKETVWLSATGEKYHSIPNCGRMNPNKARQISLSDALQNNYEKCTKCY